MALLIGAALAINLAQAAPAGQDQEGRQAYDRYCAQCHNVSLRGSAHGAPLLGPHFVSRWEHSATVDLAAYLRSNMSTTVPPTTGNEVYVAIAAYLQQSNGITPDEAPLLADTGTSTPDLKPDLETTVPELAKTAGRWVNRVIPELAPVTDALLRKPPDSDWLSWRRTQDGQGYSPLGKINRGNVSRLKLAWVITMYEGSNQATPIVHDGVMFLTHPGNIIQAIDAATGELIWEYAYPYPPASRTMGGPMRNIAIYKDKIYLATYDAAVVAIDARSGVPVWRAVQADYTKGYTHTIGPVIADGVVVSGMNGCERYNNDGCFITGHDPETGRELWRTSTLALPGDPNEATWGNVPPERRAGGDNWIPGTFDPELGTYFVGTSQAKPWVAVSRGMTPLDAALYTSSTLALDPRTGRMKWHFQHNAGDSLDQDASFERILIDVGAEKQVVTIGKDGILWKLDRRSGAFRGVAETLPQDIYARIDHQTGRLEYRQDIIDAKIDDAVTVCPGAAGGHNWQASAYSPETGALIIPLIQLCSVVIAGEVEQQGSYAATINTIPMPGSDNQLGRLSSWDVESLQERWTHTQRAMFMTGVLTTAGKLAFVGDVDRYFKAFDVDNGKVLWQTRLGAPLHGYPIAYAVDGKQYVAVPTGIGLLRMLTAEQSPEIYQPIGGNALYVFELAE
ncbi:outer membrane protein assembly factor BamB family protein [Steroidobacter denitrificans]|uniref:outer membrane protein assembly factor BamB family protein n=1 Tax=Steroidobacter denitrificans TaxID=465721 RepID=UPI0008311FE5|nr:PQQ-binding-like beta-propeller repeat protein [Steroidobacter denitrificans]